MEHKGKLIVIDGVDSSGKETQTAHLVQWLQDKGKPVRRISFPDYGSSCCAPVEAYLAGDFGHNPSDVNPYAASTFYAVDRFASFKQKWGQALKEGEIVVADRYTTSNAIHQGVKLKGQARANFYTWLYDLEYDKMQLPQPDLVIFLDMPPEKAIQLMEHRRSKMTGGEQKDIHEANHSYLFACYQAALDACAHYGWTRVCSVDENSQLRTVADISREICQLVQQVL